MLAAVFGFAAESSGWLSNLQVFLLLAAAVLAYSVLQAWMVNRREGEFLYLNPTIHTALFSNVLLLGVGASLLVLPPEFGGFRGEVTHWMVLWMLLHLSGCIALWSGYWSRLSVVLVRRLQRSPLLHRMMRRELRVNSVLLWVLFALGVASEFTLIGLGIFGYSRDAAAAARSVGIQQYLSMGRSLIPLTLLVLALEVFWKRPKGRRPIFPLAMVFVISVFSGFLSGFKSQVVMPILIVGVAYYATRRRIPRWALPIFLVLLSAAFMVIEPFRDARQADESFQSDSFFYIFETMFDPQESQQGLKRPSAGEQLSQLVWSRFPIPLWSEGLRYVEENDGLPEGSPEFLRNILIAPLWAVVPRAVWPSKPQAREGHWFYVEVLGRSGESSVSTSGVTSLYFAGGWIAVLTGFFFFGVLQRWLFRGLLVYGAGGMLIFLGLFSGLREFDMYHSLLVHLIRTMPMLLVLQYFLLRPVGLRRRDLRHVSGI